MENKGSAGFTMNWTLLTYSSSNEYLLFILTKSYIFDLKAIYKTETGETALRDIFLVFKQDLAAHAGVILLRTDNSYMGTDHP